MSHTASPPRPSGRRLRHVALVPALGLLCAFGGADGRFIDGFPDVPLLESVRLADGESPVIFDTPGGTVAEVQLTSSEPDGLLARYGATLRGLGWSCTQGRSLICQRADNRLKLSAAAGGADRFALRLEPRR